jgi:hypothetical protein
MHGSHPEACIQPMAREARGDETDRHGRGVQPGLGIGERQGHGKECTHRPKQGHDVAERCLVEIGPALVRQPWGRGRACRSDWQGVTGLRWYAVFSVTDTSKLGIRPRARACSGSGNTSSSVTPRAYRASVSMPCISTVTSRAAMTSRMREPLQAGSASKRPTCASFSALAERPLRSRPSGPSLTDAARAAPRVLDRRGSFDQVRARPVRGAGRNRRVLQSRSA